MDVIYHYTSIPAFKSIIRNRQFWLTHIRHVNDTEEIKTGLKIVEEETKNYLSKCGDITKNIRLPSDTFDQYILCFCARPNNLHLWQHYSRLGGVVLGFDRKALSNPPQINIVPVSYDLEGHKLLCRKKIGTIEPVSQDDEDALKAYIQETKDYEGARKRLQNMPNYKEYRDTLSSLNSAATLLKHHDWQTEEEVRLIHWPFLCKDKGISVLPTGTNKITGKPIAVMQMDKIPLVSINVLNDLDTLRRKGFLNFLAKYDVELAS